MVFNYTCDNKLKAKYNLKLLFPTPSSGLETIVKHYIVIESLQDFEDLWILPNAGNFIIFNSGIDGFVQKYNSEDVIFELPKGFFVSRKANNITKIGINLKSVIDKDIFPIFAVELLPTGYNRLFCKNAYDLRDNMLLLNDCIRDENISFEKLYSFKNIKKEIAYIEHGLLNLKRCAQTKQQAAHEIEDIIDYIVNTMQNVKVSDILEKFSYSRSTLERDFKKVIGYTPKEFIQIVRFCMMFKNLTLNGYDYMKMDHNFFDQSHLNKAFKKFIDIPPSKLQGYVNDNNINIYQVQEDYV